MRIILLTNNIRNIDIIKNLLKSYEITLPTDAGLEIEMENKFDTIAKNVGIRARRASRKTNENFLSIDTGLFVESLNGMPGVNTFDFLGKEITDKQRCEYIIKNVDEINRKAEILTCATLIIDGKEYTVSGVTEGIIAKEPRGKKGEWYDKILELEDGRTVSELPKRERERANSIRRAIKKLLIAQILTENIKSDDEDKE